MDASCYQISVMQSPYKITKFITIGKPLFSIPNQKRFLLMDILNFLNIFKFRALLLYVNFSN